KRGAIGLEVVEHDTSNGRAQAGTEAETNLHQAEDFAEMPPLKEISRRGAVDDAGTTIAQPHEHDEYHYAPGVGRGLRREQAEQGHHAKQSRTGKTDLARHAIRQRPPEDAAP